MDEDFIKKAIAGFKRKSILVVGDVILDLYIRGEVDRISPEAPVPVVLEKSRRFILGGAGNVAANVAALGGKATLLGVVGRDGEGEMIKKLCRSNRAGHRLIVDSGRPTTLKTRAVARRHQILRVDREATGNLSRKLERKAIELISKAPDQDLVIISDYAKGFVTAGVVKALAARFGKTKIIVGLKPKTASLYKRFLLATLNLKEMAELFGISAHTAEEASRAVRAASRKLDTSIVLTRGEHGMTVYDKKTRRVSQVRARALNIFDVTGAGDTVIAALGLMLASGAKLAVAADVANHAAGLVVGKEGTETVSPTELVAYLGANESH